MPGVLHAADYCLTDMNYVLVGRGFKVPASGKCSAFIGFLSNPGAHNAPTTGTACTSTDGTTLNFTLSTSFPENGVVWNVDSLTFKSSVTGTDEFFDLVNGSPFLHYTAPFSRGTCSGTAIAAIREGEEASTVPAPPP